MNGLIWSIFGFLNKLSALSWLGESKKTFHFEIRPASTINFYMFRVYLNTLLLVHVQSEIEPIRSIYGCIKSGFSTDNCSSIEKKNHLKLQVFKDNPGSAFCYAFGMSVTYDFETIFLLASLDSLASSCFRGRLFFITGIFQSSCLNCEFGIIFKYYSINFIKVQRYKT